MRVVYTTLLGVSLVTPLVAADWPQWRGPLGTGVSSETGLPEKWNAQSVAWRVKLRGVGVSSPVVAGDAVYVTSQIGRGKRREGNHPALVQGAEAATAGERTLGDDSGAGTVTFVVAAYSQKTGKELWHFEEAAEGDLAAVHDKHNLATPSPVTDGKLVFGWFGTGQLVALDTQGRLKWKKHLGKESPFSINWGHASSPALYENLLILPCYHDPASYLLALDKNTGEVKWKVDRGKETTSYSTPIIVTGAKGPEVVLNTSEGLEAYDPRTGDALWSAKGAARFPIPVPVHDGTVLYATRGYRSGPYLAVALGGRGDVSESGVRWKVDTGAPYISSFVLYDGLLYMASELGIVTVIDPKTGERVWRERVGGIFTASPVAGDGKVYLVSETGETIVLKAGREPAVLSRNALDAHFVASPAIASGRIFLRGDDQLIAVGASGS